MEHSADVIPPMSDSSNPYASPTTDVMTDPSTEGMQAFRQAGRQVRFANFIIDYVVQMVISFASGAGIVWQWGAEGAEFIERTSPYAFGLAILFFYYFGFEVLTSRTLGKMVTGTRVVNAAGGKPSVGQILGRTLTRMIPFEALTFLRAGGRGLHDSLPETYVVRTR